VLFSNPLLVKYVLNYIKEDVNLNNDFAWVNGSIYATKNVSAMKKEKIFGA